MGSYKLLTVNGNPKTIKSFDQDRVFTAILHLAPANMVGRKGFNACPFATRGCVKGCLNTAGRGGIFKQGEDTNAIQRARIRKTEWFLDDRAGFLARLKREIHLAAGHAKRVGARFLGVRLNGTSDLDWQAIAPEILSIAQIGEIQIRFYDYTKDPSKVSEGNYWVTYSRSERNESIALDRLRQGHNVAVVFSGNDLPSTWHGFPVHDGDVSDARFLDPVGYVIGLRAKGKAKEDTSGFVVRLGRGLEKLRP